MIAIQTIRENAELVVERLAVKHFDAKEVVSKILDVDARRREVQKEVDELKAQSNKVSKEIGQLFKSGKAQEANELRAQVGQSKERIKELDHQFTELDKEQHDLLLQLPNIPCYDVPHGKTPDDNKVVRQSGELKSSEGLLPHWELASKYELIDFELGNKISGAGFPVYTNRGARLQRAMLNFFLDENTKAGYTEMQPPTVVNEDSAYGTGQLPDKEGQMYHVQNENLYLIPTAEVPLTNIFRDVLLNEKDLPIKVTGYTPCFRREAGSYGKDVRGLNRLHQFDKVEIVQLQKPDNSYTALEEMVAHVEGLLKKLNLPYRILALCGGDMSFTSAFTYDFEVYSAAQERWLEVSSVSNFESYQSNRIKLRFKNSEGKNQLVHTLNGSALAFPRILACILENNQTSDGIEIPEVLVPYCGFDTID